MRKLPIVVFALVVTMLSCMLVGCEGAASQPVEKDTVKGFWQLDATAPIGMDAYLNLGDDEAVEFYVGSLVYEGTWTVEDQKAAITWAEGETTELSYADEKLTLGGADGSRLVFVKGDYDVFLEEIGEADDEAESEEAAGDAAVASTGETVAGSTEGEADSDVEAVEQETVDEVIEAITPVVVADDATCTITVVGKGTDFTADPCYRLTFTNKTDRALYLTNEEVFTVGGREVDASIGDTAGPGETVEATLYFPKDSLGGGLELLSDVTGTCNVEVDDTLEEVASYPFHMD